MAKIKINLAEVEEKYQTEDRGVSQERNDFLLPQIIDFVQQKKWLNLSPEYQRRQVWDKKKQSQFIESLLMNLPVPPVFLFEPEYSRYEVMDGQQRLSTIVSFYNNRLKLIGLEHWSELNGLFYADLPVLVQRGLDRRRISAVILQSTSYEKDDNDLRRMVFERLNTGGQKLNAQELRNCIYASDFATLLVELAGYPTFNDLLEMPRYEDNMKGGNISQALAENTLFKRMTDCEMVLRFFSFRKKTSIKGSVKSILDKQMINGTQLSSLELQQYRDDFISRVELANELFGKDAFKLTDAEGQKPKISQPYFDAILIACDRNYKYKDSLIKEKEELKIKLHAALQEHELYEIIVGRGNTAEWIKKRLDIVDEIFVSAL